MGTPSRTFIGTSLKLKQNNFGTNMNKSVLLPKVCQKVSSIRHNLKLIFITFGRLTIKTFSLFNPAEKPSATSAFQQ